MDEPRQGRNLVTTFIALLLTAAFTVLLFGGCTVGFFWYLRACWRIAGTML